jgi:hypothetical protein
MMIDSTNSNLTKTRIDLNRMKDIVIQLIDIIRLLSKRQKLNTMTVLKHYTNITPNELEELDIQINSGTVTKK